MAVSIVDFLDLTAAGGRTVIAFAIGDALKKGPTRFIFCHIFDE